LFAVLMVTTWLFPGVIRYVVSISPETKGDGGMMKSVDPVAAPNGVATDTFPDVAVGGTDVLIAVPVAELTGAGVALKAMRF